MVADKLIAGSSAVVAGIITVYISYRLGTSEAYAARTSEALRKLPGRSNLDLRHLTFGFRAATYLGIVLGACITLLGVLTLMSAHG